MHSPERYRLSEQLARRVKVIFRYSFSRGTLKFFYGLAFFSDLSLRYINKADRLVPCLTDVMRAISASWPGWRKWMGPNPLTFEGNILLRQINATSPGLS